MLIWVKPDMWRILSLKVMHYCVSWLGEQKSYQWEFWLNVSLQSAGYLNQGRKANIFYSLVIYIYTEKQNTRTAEFLLKNCMFSIEMLKVLLTALSSFRLFLQLSPWFYVWDKRTNGTKVLLLKNCKAIYLFMLIEEVCSLISLGLL